MVQTLAKEGLVKGVEMLGDDDEWLRKCIKPSLNSVESERAVLSYLSIFPASFDVEAAAAVLGVDMSTAKRKLLFLQRRFLVSAQAAVKRDPQGQQYFLHLLIRELSAENMEDQADYVQVQHRFVCYFLTLWKASEQDTEESDQRLNVQRQSVAKAVKLLSEQQQPLENFQAFCSLGIHALLSVNSARLDLNIVITALGKLLSWARQADYVEALLGAREQLAYLLSTDHKKCQDANSELQAVLAERQARSSPGDASLVLCLEGLANAAVTLGNAGMLPTDEAETACDAYRGRILAILTATHGDACSATLRSAGWVAFGLQDMDASVQQLRSVFDKAVCSLGARHPATADIQSHLAERLSQASHKEMCSSAAFLKKHVNGMTGLEAALPAAVIQAWLREHLQKCQQQLGPLSTATITAHLSLGAMLTRSHEAIQQREGLQEIRQGLQLGESYWGKHDEYFLHAEMEVHAAALQRLWQLDDAFTVIDGVLQLGQQAFGDESSYITHCMLQQAKLLQLQGKYTAAEEMLKAAEEQLQGRQGSNMSLVTCGLCFDMAANLSLQGRWVCYISVHLLLLHVSTSIKYVH